MQKILRILSLFILPLFASLALAANGIQLLEKPKKDAKVISEVQPGQAIIPIYQEKDWVKIANPKNGEVGWVSKQTLKNNNVPTISIQTFGRSSQDGSDSGFQMMQVSTSDSTSKADAAELQKINQQIDQQQQLMQENFNKIMLESMRNFNNFMQNFNASANQQRQENALPVLQPIIIMPNGQEVKDKSWWQQLKEKMNLSDDSTAKEAAKDKSNSGN